VMIFKLFFGGLPLEWKISTTSATKLNLALPANYISVCHNKLFKPT